MVRSNTLLMVAAVTIFAFPAAAAAVNVTTWRYDTARTGQNVNETQLTSARVNVNTFGKLFTYIVDGYVYAQPLYFSAGGRNMVFVATEHDSVYAFDADRNVQIWKANLLDAAHGVTHSATPVPSNLLATNDIVPEVGITGTPVIDPIAGTLYVVAKSYEAGAFVNRLHALDVLTGHERPSSPVVIQGSVAGAGAGSSGGKIAFLPQWELNRSGLLLYNGSVYVAFAAHGDNGPYHGWLFAFDAQSLQQTAIFNTSPSGRGNGIWGSGAGLAADTVNGVPRMFFATGNFIGGAVGGAGPNPKPPYTGPQNYSNAIVRLDLSNDGLRVEDEWTPFDQAELSTGDSDQTSGGVLLLPDQSGAHVHELIQVGKNGRVEVLDRDDLGGFNTYNNVVQEVSGQTGGLWSTPAYWNGNVYFWGNDNYLRQFTLSRGLLSSKPVASGTIHSFYPGASAVVSSNGTTNGIVWAIRTDSYVNGTRQVLYAFDATNVAKLLYSSADAGARDVGGKAVKFVVPIVANGKVYMGAQGEVDVYGLLAGATPQAPAPTFSPTPGTFATPQNVSLADSLSGTAIYYTVNGTSPTRSSTRYSGPITVSATTTINAFAVAAGYADSSVASATYTIGTAPSINFSNGFSSATGLTLNGSAVNTDDSRLQLTTGDPYQAGSTFWNKPVGIQNFVTDFTFQLSGTPPLADGITFTIQAAGPTALGAGGGALGYGADKSIGRSGIPTSVAIKFDLYSNAGEGNNSTGIFTNGAAPTVPSFNLAGSGIVLGNGDTIAAHLTYNGSILSLTLTDPVNHGTYSHTFAVNIPQVIGTTSAYVGFTGGTGGLKASQKILTWTYTSQAPPAAAVVYQTERLDAVSSGPPFHGLGWAGFPDGLGTLLEASKAGDNVTFTLNLAQAGTYDMHVTTKNFNIRGVWQASVDGVNVGTPVDEYSPGEKYADNDVGTVRFNSAGQHKIKFTVTGRNPASQGWLLSFDTLSFAPR
jgi:hypothetical protein